MEMISVTKLNRVNKIITGFKPYFQRLEGIFNDLAGAYPGLKHPFFEKKDNPGVCLCVITSDSGLCGLYNANILRFAEEQIARIGLDKVKLVVCGRKGFNYFKKKQLRILNSYIGLNGRYSEDAVDRISEYLADVFLKGDCGQVYVAYTHREKIVLHKNSLVKVLEIDLPKQEGAYEKRYILEPGGEILLSGLIPQYIRLKMRLLFMEAFASEHASRAVAMKAATDNAGELSQNLILLRNKVRQASITQDIMEIISSAEALKG